MKMNETVRENREYAGPHKRKKIWVAAVACLAAAVGVGTVYALILPAVTLEADQTLACSYVVHQHDASSCYDENGEVSCGYADYAVHTHDRNYCYDAEGSLVCQLNEVEAHEHNASCYEEQTVLVCEETVSNGHEHTEECYESQSVLTCGRDEVVPHTHSDSCYDQENHLTCGLLQVEEHAHTEECLRSEVTAAESGLTETLDVERMTEANSVSVPQEVLDKLAEDQEIYPGVQSADENGNEVWTVFDKKDEEEANVKATITLPSGKSSAKNQYLYIRTVGETDPYYPEPDTVTAELGQWNDLQCYAIHWIEIYQVNDANEGPYTDQNGNKIGAVYTADDGSRWVCLYQTKSVLDDTGYATVNIAYQKDSAYLKGTKANRKLRIFNSRKKEGTELEGTHSTLTDVIATDAAYTGFTFQTNRGGPYVFASQYIYEGYVSALTVDKITDGSEPFDSDNEPGNDSGGNNKIVRSNDVIQYDLKATFAARQTSVTSEQGRLYLEAILDKDVTEAAFDTSQMLWMGNNYTIEYLDKNNEVVFCRDVQGNYLNKNGDPIDLNAVVSDSNGGTSSYTTSIVKQKLVGFMDLKIGENNTGTILDSTKELNVAIQVLNASNGKSFEPAFKVWFDGNKENYGSESASDGGIHLSTPETNNEETAEAVMVSASAKFNLELRKNDNVSYKGWFDSSKGIEVTEDGLESYEIEGETVTAADLYKLLEKLADLDENQGKANPEKFTDQNNVCQDLRKGIDLKDYANTFEKIRYGRITGYGITLQVYNSAESDKNPTGRRFKGISLPQGNITFDLNLATKLNGTDDSKEKENHYAFMWDYNENVSNEKGHQGNNLYWASLNSSKFAAWAAPYNGNYEVRRENCYYGGTWNLTDSNSDKSSYSFQVQDYDFNFGTLGLTFPTHKAATGNAAYGYNIHIGCFSAGYIQVLNVFPRHAAGTYTMETTVNVKNLALTTKDGTRISTDESDSTGWKQETNQGDNEKADSIPLYAKGKMTKANAFCTRGFYENEKSGNIDYGFLGTYFWGTSYDCSAFAGQEITLAGSARINAGDYQIRHMNMLQLFDSAALSIDDKATGGKNGKPYVVSTVEGSREGDTKILYAADSDYPHGYDTNQGISNASGQKVSGNDVMAYMSTVREEDLIYFTSLAELEEKGYTCIGVLAELRNWTINGEGGYSTTFKIPMTVKDEEAFVGKTVCTVNAVRIWTNVEDMTTDSGKYVSWEDGENNPALEKNSVEGYDPVSDSTEEHYRGEVVNGEGKDTYIKTEYQNGNIVLGTNAGGYVYGSSLLILNYEAKVGITANTGSMSGELPTCDLDKGNYTVNYQLTGIRTTTEGIGSSKPAKTALTVLAKLDEKYKDEKRIEISTGSYRMISDNSKVLVDENGQEIDFVEISGQEGSPTKIRYKFRGGSDTDIYEIEVYAKPATDKKQVTFCLDGVTVGNEVPNISFEAEVIPEKVKKNSEGRVDNIITSAYISGTGDVRAYEEINGNMASQSVGIIQLGATRLSKTVDTGYIEQDGSFQYTITYTNGGDTLERFYLNDLLPDKEDTRGSAYHGKLALTGVDATLSGSSEFTAEVDFYYSTTDYKTLCGLVDLSNGENRDKEKIEELLERSGYFKPLGSIAQGDATVTYSTDYTNLTDKSAITGIYVVVKNLNKDNSINIKISVKSSDNEAGDVYKNVAYSWLGDASENLTSRAVETTVLSRAISGVVWYDANLNGVYDTGEELLEGVKCTLFKWDDTEGKYMECTKNVTGDTTEKGEIKPITTGEDGSYTFSKLAPGKYIVAFFGETLKKYTGATTYQVNGENDHTSSDGVPLVETENSLAEKVSIEGIDNTIYSYAIAYSLDSTRTSYGSRTSKGNGSIAGDLFMHSIDDILKNNIPLTDYKELYEHQDLGLIIAGYELPETGGAGTGLFLISGLVLMAGAVGCGYGRRHRRERRVKN